jgi:hypothetical protein
VILLDFGAAREFSADVVASNHALLRAGVAGDPEALEAAARHVGFINAGTRPHHIARMLRMMDMAMEPLRAPGVFDFGATDLAQALRVEGMALGEDRTFATIPPMDVLYLQRKVAGMYLLATRLRARVAVSDLVAPHL